MVFEKKWESCCRGRRSNCPSISLGKGESVFIRDDYGSEVELKIDDVLKLKDLPNIGNYISIYGKSAHPVKLTVQQLEDVLVTLEELLQVATGLMDLKEEKV